MKTKCSPLFILLLSASFISNGQDCLSTGITFSTQGQIDSFSINYPGCVNIIGGVEIKENEPGAITNLKGLSQITFIGGQLKLSMNNSLDNLEGLESLDSIGGCLLVKVNKSLINFKGLDNLTSIGECMDIYNNASLDNVENLSNLSSIGGYLKIHKNTSLKSLSGLNDIESVGGFTYIEDNPALLGAEDNEKLKPINKTMLRRHKAWINTFSNEQSFSGYIREVRDSSILLSKDHDDHLHGQTGQNIYVNNLRNIKLRKEGKMKNGVLIGGLSGLVVGIIWASTIEPPEPTAFFALSGEDPSNVFDRPLAVMGSMTAGLLVGAIVGSIKIEIPINGNQKSFSNKRVEINKYRIWN